LKGGEERKGRKRGKSKVFAVGIGVSKGDPGVGGEVGVNRNKRKKVPGR